MAVTTLTYYHPVRIFPYRIYITVPAFFSDSWPLKMEPVHFPETSVNNYDTTPCNIPDERSSQSVIYTLELSIKGWLLALCLPHYSSLSRSKFNGITTDRSRPKRTITTTTTSTAHLLPLNSYVMTGISPSETQKELNCLRILPPPFD